VESLDEISPIESTKVLQKIKNEEVRVQSKKQKSPIQAEGKAHHQDTAKADKKVKVPEKTCDALEKKAKAEGKTPDEKAAEIVEKKTKETEMTFEGKINKYGFLHFEKALYETLGWTKGEDIKVKITKTENGIAIERS
jgi:hypothetical protein